MDGSCDPEHGWAFWLLMSPVIAMLWLMASGLLVIWWRLIINPRIKDGKIR